MKFNSGLKQSTTLIGVSEDTEASGIAAGRDGGVWVTGVTTGPLDGQDDQQHPSF